LLGTAERVALLLFYLGVAGETNADFLPRVVTHGDCVVVALEDRSLKLHLLTGGDLRLHLTRIGLRIVILISHDRSREHQTQGQRKSTHDRHFFHIYSPNEFEMG